MDISGMFNETGPDANAGEATDMTTDVTATTSSSPVVDVNSLLGDDNDSDGSATTTSQMNDIVPNETVTTNDSSVVGEVKESEPEDLDQGPTVEPFIPEPVSEVEPPLEAETIPTSGLLPSEDPEKTDFIKTYTAEYDESLARATDAIQKMLDSVDKSIHDKLPDISIPQEALEFLKKPPAESKVEKFEDVRELVKEIMDRANEAKQQSEAAATEASRIYDEVQAFKRDTKQQIAELISDTDDSAV